MSSSSALRFSSIGLRLVAVDDVAASLGARNEHPVGTLEKSGNLTRPDEAPGIVQ